MGNKGMAMTRETKTMIRNLEREISVIQRRVWGMERRKGAAQVEIERLLSKEISQSDGGGKK